MNNPVLNVLLAPDSFKHAATAFEICSFMQSGIKQTNLPIRAYHLPMADGGEGSLDVVLANQQGELIKTSVENPLGKIIETYWGWYPQTQTAIIEMAKASGIALLHKHELNPMLTNTYGTGQLIREAILKGAKQIIIFIGGSATNDGGAGMLQALGVRFYDSRGQCIERASGGNLDQIANINLDNFILSQKNITIRVACDVTAPLLGSHGASHVFAPQKGATAQMVNILENNLTHWATLTEQRLQTSTRFKEGSGAAGGLGFGLMAYLRATFQKGAETVWQISGGDSLAAQMNPTTDLVITGEGRTDHQTLLGKVPIAVARLVKPYQLPIIIICGSVGENIQPLYNDVYGIYSILQMPCSLEEAIMQTPIWVARLTENIVRTWYHAKNNR